MENTRNCDKCGVNSIDGLSESWMSGMTLSSQTYVEGDSQVTTTEYSNFEPVDGFLCLMCFDSARKEYIRKQTKWVFWLAVTSIALMLFGILLLGLFEVKAGMVPAGIGIIFLLISFVKGLDIILILLRPNGKTSRLEVLEEFAFTKAKRDGRENLWTPRAFERLMKKQK